MIEGFNDCAKEAKTIVTGGQSIMNPWPIIGGVANVVCDENEYIKVNQGEPGDILILTKPLGTQVAVNNLEWLVKGDEKATKVLTKERVMETYYMAMESMSVLNLNAATLCKKYECHGATDITGFGIMGHAQNLVKVQKANVDYKIHSLPVLDGTAEVNNQIFDFKLLDGFSAETSGGLLIMVPPSKADDFQKELLESYGQKCWVIGEVTEGSH